MLTSLSVTIQHDVPLPAQRVAKRHNCRPLAQRATDNTAKDDNLTGGRKDRDNLIGGPKDRDNLTGGGQNRDNLIGDEQSHDKKPWRLSRDNVTKLTDADDRNMPHSAAFCFVHILVTHSCYRLIVRVSQGCILKLRRRQQL